MAVTSAYEIGNGREGSDKSTGKRNTRTRTRIFRVVTNNPHDGSDLVLAACPPLASFYPTASGFVLTERKAAQDGRMKTIWTVTLVYSLGDTDSSQANPQQADPLDDSRQFDWTTQTRQEPTHQDKDSKAILNSAGQYFENGVVRDVTTWQVTITQNCIGVPSWFDNYRDAINSSSIKIDGFQFNAYQVKVMSIKIGHWQTRNDIAYRPLTIVLGIRTSWRKMILDEGLVALNGNPNDPNYGKPALAIMADGRKATRPVPLDGSGNVLANPSPSTAKFITVKLYPEMDLSQLPIQ